MTQSGGKPTTCIGYQVPANQSDPLCCAGCTRIHVAFLTSCLFICADKEYLHKDNDGNIVLHNAETREQSLYLSNSTFVIQILFLGSEHIC